MEVSMSPKRYKTVQEWIHPAEADAVAGVYGEASDAVRAYHSQYVRILADLGSDWEGRQKDLFMAEAKTKEQKLKEYCMFLGQVAQTFRTIQVMIEVQVEEIYV
jgi:uncharacterized protein YukE